jgi:hypothetical protein
VGFWSCKLSNKKLQAILETFAKEIPTVRDIELCEILESKGINKKTVDVICEALSQAKGKGRLFM